MKEDKDWRATVTQVTELCADSMDDMSTDKMHGPHGAISGSDSKGRPYARVHGTKLLDQSSCVLPDTGTLTLEQWREQQNAGEREP